MDDVCGMMSAPWKGNQMIQVRDLSFAYPQKEIFKGVSFTLKEGQHCAFIGASGSGKTTLLRLLMDSERYTYEGSVQMDSRVRIGHVSQFPQRGEAQALSVHAYLAEPHDRLQERIAGLCTDMETAADNPETLEKLLITYQEAMDAYDALGGDDFEARCSRQLGLAGLDKHAALPVSALSGGEFKLVQVMREMLVRPDLLIMDEPDAFLDFDNLRALRNLIYAYKGTLLVITHNRYLLNHCFNKLLHLENMELQEFDGTFIDYRFSLLMTKIEMRELQLADDAEIARNEILIEKFRKIATLTDEESAGRKLKARVKVQDRLQARRIKAPFVAIRQPNIRFHTDEAGEAHFALSVRGYSAAYDVKLFEDVHFEIGPSQKIALIGANGVGKTTLLRDIWLNNQDTIVVHPHLKMAYLSQHQNETLDEAQTIVEMFMNAGFRNREEIGEYLCSYGFEGEALDQRVSNFSGGERNLLQLARISAGKAGLLLLDEPTSHLDTYAQVALEKAIQQYGGAVLMVSHDFYAIANCMDAVLFIENRTIRRMSIRKFRKLVYAGHEDMDVLMLEQRKKTLEAGIEHALQKGDTEQARALSETLAPLVEALKRAFSQNRQ